MKVAVSIPDPIFAKAEALAKRSKLSRSRLYAKAVAAYVERHTDDEITEAMEAVLNEVGNEADPFLREAARQALAPTEW